jgi:hypothetical protein
LIIRLSCIVFPLRAEHLQHRIFQGPFPFGNCPLRSQACQASLLHPSALALHSRPCSRSSKSLGRPSEHPSLLHPWSLPADRTFLTEERSYRSRPAISPLQGLDVLGYLAAVGTLSVRCLPIPWGSLPPAYSPLRLDILSVYISFARFATSKTLLHQLAITFDPACI